MLVLFSIKLTFLIYLHFFPFLFFLSLLFTPTSASADGNDNNDDDGVVLRYDNEDANKMQADEKKLKREREAQKKLFAYARKEVRGSGGDRCGRIVKMVL